MPLRGIDRSASSSRNRSFEEKYRKEKVSNSNNLLTPASTYTLILDTLDT